MNKDVTLSFCVFSSKSRLAKGEQVASGWQRCTIYKGRHVRGARGFSRSVIFIKLSNGKLIVTNDLWDDTSEQGWVHAVPEGALVGHKLSTRVCHPRSQAAIDVLLGLLVPRRWETAPYVTRKGLTDEEAHNLENQFGYDELPFNLSREYHTPTSHSYFCSPDDVRISHIKIGTGPVQPFRGADSFDGVDPSCTPVYLLYGKEESYRGLHNGDVINSSYVYDLPGW